MLDGPPFSRGRRDAGVARKYWQADADGRCTPTPPLDHADHIIAVHRPISERSGAVTVRNQRSFLIGRNAGRLQVGRPYRLRLMVRRHFVELAALLVQAEPPALAASGNSPPPACDDALTRAKAVDHGADQRAVAQARIVSVSIASSRARVCSVSSTGVLPFLMT